MSIPYPWQQQQWNRLQSQIQAHKLPHALLICGRPGLGRESFATTLARSLLCSQPDTSGRPCGHCQPCRLCDSDCHPDLYRVAREEDRHQILIDPIRALCAFMALSRQFDRYKVGLVVEAEKLNTNAANSLLKTLEEPAPYTLIILVSEGLAQIPPTVRSRCQHVIFPSPPRDSAKQWLVEQRLEGDVATLLSLAQRRPLTARDLVSGDTLKHRQSAFSLILQSLKGEVSAVATAKQLEKLDIRLLLDWLISWCMDAIRLHFNVAAHYLDNPDLYPELVGISARMDLRSIFGLLDEMVEFKRLLSASLNSQLLLEDVVLAWSMKWANP